MNSFNVTGNEGFIKLNRSKLLEELLTEPACFILLTQIAYRARRVEGISIKKVGIGEAFIGDYKSVGLTRQKYRTALSKLQDWGLITIKTTNKGTVAKLTGKQVFDINEINCNQQDVLEVCTNKKKETKHKHMCDGEEKKGLGILGNVRLNESEVEDLQSRWGKEKFDKIVKQLDEKIAEGKEESKNHYVTLIKYERYLKDDGKNKKSKVVSFEQRGFKGTEVNSASFRKLSREAIYGE